MQIISGTNNIRTVIFENKDEELMFDAVISLVNCQSYKDIDIANSRYNKTVKQCPDEVEQKDKDIVFRCMLPHEHKGDSHVMMISWRRKKSMDLSELPHLGNQGKNICP